MRVLINAVSIKEGGSRVVLAKLLPAMQQLQPKIEWIVAAHPNCVGPSSNCGSITWISVPEALTSGLAIFRWYEIELPAIVKRYRPDVLFSHTNYLPHRPVACATLLLIQHAGHFSAEFDRLAMSSLTSRFAQLLWRQKRRWVRRSARAATLVTVQTAALAAAISSQISRPRERIAVIPHGPGAVHHRLARRPAKEGGAFKIGYVTKWGVQKNFETLLAAARELAHRGYHFKIILTLYKGSLETANVMAIAQSLGIDGLIENYGEVSPEQVSGIYDGLDIFVFASFCESFGFPMVEAMARGLPIVVASTDENVEVTREAALKFEPLDARTLADHLARLMDDDQDRARRSKASLAASRNFSWEKAADQTVAALKTLA